MEQKMTKRGPGPADFTVDESEDEDVTSPRGATRGAPVRPQGGTVRPRVVSPIALVPTTPGRQLRDHDTIQRPARYQDTTRAGAPRPRAMVAKEVLDNYWEAMESEDSNKWYRAMEDELESLQKCKTWTLVPLPKRRKTIDNRWVFVKKMNSQNEVLRYKARLVARGFTQRPGINYDNT